MTFLSFLAGNKETKTTLEKTRFTGKICTYKYTTYLGRVLWFLTGWVKGPPDLLQDEAKKLAKFKTLLNLYGSENCNSKFLQDFSGKKKTPHAEQNKWTSG